MSDDATITLDHTLGELVAELPARARVFERHSLDYCCHGQRSLADAAAAADLDANDLAAELASVVDASGSEVDALHRAALVEHILRTHHAYLHEELPALQALADKVDSVHSCRHPELSEVARLVHVLADDLTPHLTKEEQVLFPAITRQSTGAEGAGVPLSPPIRAMMTEHEAIGALLGELRSTARGYKVPADGCASYHGLYSRLADLEADTFRHVHLENNVLFPQVFSAA
ncbi:MAG: iron-sulfur cluster repair di-iron protein [Microthrixaceae bacterium]